MWEAASPNIDDRQANSRDGEDPEGHGSRHRHRGNRKPGRYGRSGCGARDDGWACRVTPPPARRKAYRAFVRHRVGDGGNWHAGDSPGDSGSERR
ncbi:hypothetical protein KRMM14A1259_19260 [Krasilnikovia sp. MM14-A1259]